MSCQFCRGVTSGMIPIMTLIVFKNTSRSEDPNPGFRGHGQNVPMNCVKPIGSHQEQYPLQGTMAHNQA